MRATRGGWPSRRSGGRRGSGSTRSGRTCGCGSIAGRRCCGAPPTSWGERDDDEADANVPESPNGSTAEARGGDGHGRGGGRGEGGAVRVVRAVGGGGGDADPAWPVHRVREPGRQPAHLRAGPGGVAMGKLGEPSCAMHTTLFAGGSGDGIHRARVRPPRRGDDGP